MEETLNTQRIYPKEYQFWKETNILDLHDYRPMVNSFGQVLFTLGDDIYGGTSYSGDTFALYYNCGEWGYLEFGWGVLVVLVMLYKVVLHGKKLKRFIHHYKTKFFVFIKQKIFLTIL